MRITLITVGKIKEKFYQDAISEYAKRLSRYCKLDVIQVTDEKTPTAAALTSLPGSSSSKMHSKQGDSGTEGSKTVSWPEKRTADAKTRGFPAEKYLILTIFLRNTHPTSIGIGVCWHRWPIRNPTSILPPFRGRVQKD